MGSKGIKTPYYLYHLSMHMGFCHGPIDSFEQVYFNEKPIWTDDDEEPQRVAGERDVDKGDLFGGDEREGGIVGTLEFRMGTETQLMPASLAERLGLTPQTAPGFRGLAHILLRGNSKSDEAGAVISANQPRVPAMWARIRRLPKTLLGNTIAIPFTQKVKGEKDVEWVDANPAAVIHEVIVDSQFGMGGSVEDLDADKMSYAASVLFDEDFGISLFWKRQSTIEDFIREILDHINGLFYFNPYTGKGVLKLLRDDYDPNTLRRYGPDNCRLIRHRRKLWGETVNEITVTYTVPGTEQSDAVTYQDPGNIAQQGNTVSETRNYYAIRNKALAEKVCARELRVASAPVAAVELKVLRDQWQEMPGDCIRFEYPPHGITEVILRVMDIDWGKVDDAYITVQLTEDIFGLSAAEYASPGGGEWEDPGKDPNGGGAVADLGAIFFAAPYTLIQQAFIEQLHPQYLDDENYPRITIGAIVAPPNDADIVNFNMWVPGVANTGDPEWIDLGERTLTGKAEVVGDPDGANPAVLPAEVESTVFFVKKRGGIGPKVGSYVILGDDGEEKDEWALITGQNADGSWTLMRGVLDTVPRLHENSPPAYFIGESWFGYDTGESLADPSVELYRLQPRTSRGLRKFDLTQEVSTVRPDRQYRPYRPANCKVESIMFGKLDETQAMDPSTILDDENEPRRWKLHCSWSRRNRMSEENVVRRWDDADMLPEAGQTTTIRITLFGELLAEFVGIEGTETELEIRPYTLTAIRQMKIAFIAVRDGFESLQHHEIGLDLYIKGFGSDMGYVYGGWPSTPFLTNIEELKISLPALTTDGNLFNSESKTAKMRTSYWTAYPPDTFPLVDPLQIGVTGTIDIVED